MCRRGLQPGGRAADHEVPTSKGSAVCGGLVFKCTETGNTGKQLVWVSSQTINIRTSRSGAHWFTTRTSTVETGDLCLSRSDPPENPVSLTGEAAPHRLGH